MIAVLFYCAVPLYQIQLKCSPHKAEVGTRLSVSIIKLKSDFLTFDFIMSVMRLHALLYHFTNANFCVVNEALMHCKIKLF